MKKYIFIVLGTISLALGIMGVVTPGLPTTPFILLTGYLYAKGSPRLYQKLKDNKFTGRYLDRMSEGPSLKFRIFSLVLMWCMVCFTSFVVFKEGKMHYIMLGLGVIGTIFQLIFLRKKKTVPKILSEEEIKNENNLGDKEID